MGKIPKTDHMSGGTCDFQDSISTGQVKLGLVTGICRKIPFCSESIILGLEFISDGLLKSFLHRLEDIDVFEYHPYFSNSLSMGIIVELSKKPS